MTSATESQAFPVRSGVKTDSTESGADIPESSQTSAGEALEQSLDEALDATFPASDPIAITSARADTHPDIST